LKTSDFDYLLPQELIAQTPVEPRDHSRLLICHRRTDARACAHFYDLPRYLKDGDVLVINNTKVIRARLFGVKADTGAHVEVLLLSRQSGDRWQALVRPAKRLKVGAEVIFGEGKLRCTVEEELPEGQRKLQFMYDGVFEEILDELGTMPLPPYIHEKLKDKTRYQTVYARQDGSAAAPTAGLHFTPELMKKLEEAGVIFAPLLLHVGLGTFRPVKEEDISRHVMHSEYYEMPEKTAELLNRARQEGRRIIAVGTTSVRVLESVADANGRFKAQSGWTDIFIAPGYIFRGMDGLITNFHLPRSTLLMLVSAWMGRENAMEAYRFAVERRYRFFSFGDAMLIL
jgi:S-adenosylmethionine:tRNA ribosyltransferase-isomerase